MAQFDVKFRGDTRFKVGFRGDSTFSSGFNSATVVETGDYEKLANKPSYNGVVWEGNKTFEDVGDYNLSNLEIKALFDRVFRGGN